MTKVLMVCLGNICRSPMAEGVLRIEAEKHKIELEIDSAGTGNYHVGDHPDHRAVKCMRNHGIDISGLRARQFSRNDFDDFDVIFTMDESNHRNVLAMSRSEEDKKKVRMFLNEKWPGENRPVPDPYFGEQIGFDEVFDLLSKASASFLQSMKK